LNENSSEAVRRYLQDALSAQSSFESQLGSFSEEGDDEEVRSCFSHYAAQMHGHYDRLAGRIEQLGGSPSAAKSFFERIFGFGAGMRGREDAHAEEERTAQNLIAAFSVAGGGCAIFEALAAVARAAGDRQTEGLARELESEQRQTAEKIWRFIPSRVKIAFNMLTPHEIDPAIETKAADDRVLT
jgi:ferritin-like metal-binding protein YciE